MKKSSKKPGGITKKRTTRTQSQRGKNAAKLLVLSLAGRMRTAGGKRPKTPRPPGRPIAKIKGNAVAGGAGALFCSLIGDMADKAVDEMEQAIMQDDDAALQKAIEDFESAWNTGHSRGCYFTYV